jgi:RimJ/RimL family protein N-acetyltransferase
MNMKNTFETSRFCNHIENISSQVCFQAQLELEGLQIIDNKKIIRIPTHHFDIEKDKESAQPKLIAMRDKTEITVFYSEEILKQGVADFDARDKESFFYEKDAIIDMLKNKNQLSEVAHSLVYVFPKKIETHAENTKIFVGSHDEAIQKFDSSFYNAFPMVYAALCNNEIAACCVSARESDSAGEAWIFTLPQYRKQGFGIQAVLLWASELQKQNKIPFYSHDITNIASQKLAEKLGLIKVFETVFYE